MKFSIVNSIVVLCFCNVSSRSLNKNSQNSIFDETNTNHWKLQAQWLLRSKLLAPLNTKIAKNVIFFIGDGMSLATLAATRAYLGQQHAHLGEELKLSFEDAPFTGLSKTYCVDSSVADSACSGTAYLSGVKANVGTVGVNAAVKRGNCDGQRDTRNRVTGLMDWAQKAGKGTGVVTTTRVTHATPAASYAHSADRKWECDTDIPQHGQHCDDIALQLVRGPVGSRIDVVMGGGRKKFVPYSERDMEGHFGQRSDGRNLIQEWVSRKDSRGQNPRYVYNKKQLLETNTNEYNSLLGLFSPDHMPYHLEANHNEDPTLTEMTLKAIQMLSKKKNGYFLFVESGRIDTAHHENKARKALDETAELAKAFEATLKAINLEDTLVVVTADHSHGLMYNGYSDRGSDILGFTKINATDSLPYTILSYGSGPGFKPTVGDRRHNLAQDNLKDPNYTYPSLVPLPRAVHGGEDVAVYARGPWAHLFTGSFEQNYIPHAIAFASCLGSGLRACDLK